MATTRGLLVRLEVRAGKDAEVETFLRSALPMVREETATTAWFAIRFGRSEYGIFDAFPDEAGRQAHLGGKAAAALMASADTLLTEAPRIQKVTILADKLPTAAFAAPTTKAILLTFDPKPGYEKDVETFLVGAQPMVNEEPATTAWFAIHFDGGAYGIFDVFADNSGRIAHLVGHVPRELLKHGLSFLGGIPDLALIDVLAEKAG